MRYERSIAIASRLDKLLALVRRGNHPCRELAEKLGVSEQTVYRDILYLRHEGHAIHSVRLSDRWVYRLNKNGSRQTGVRRT